MNKHKIIQEAQHAINALTNDKKATIASVRAYWDSYVADEEPSLYIPKSARTKAQIVRRLQDVIAWMNSFGRVQPYATAGYSDLTEAHEAALAEDEARALQNYEQQAKATPPAPPVVQEAFKAATMVDALLNTAANAPDYWRHMMEESASQVPAQTVNRITGLSIEQRTELLIVLASLIEVSGAMLASQRATKQ